VGFEDSHLECNVDEGTVVVEFVFSCVICSHTPNNDISVNDGPHIRRWSHKMIILKKVN